MKTSCTKCTDFVNCRTQIVYPTPCHTGGLLAIGEAPGRDEDIAGEGFVGVAGKTLDKLLYAHKISRNDYGRANICRCRPPQNRKPTTNEINACLPYLAELIVSTKPKIILAIGSTPTSIFCGKGSLYSILNNGWQRDDWASANYIESAHPTIKPILQYVRHIVPSPHTSPLAFNRNCPSGEKWAVIAAKQIKTAISLLQI